MCPCRRRAGSSPGRQQGSAQPFLLSPVPLLGLVSPFFQCGREVGGGQKGAESVGQEPRQGRVGHWCSAVLAGGLSICNSELDPGTSELGLIFSSSLELHAQASYPSASALLPPNWCNSHLNKPTWRHLLGKVNSTEAALVPPARSVRNACAATSCHFHLPPQVQGLQIPSSPERGKRVF